MGTVGFVRSIEKMEFHVYYYPILILFLANFASAILQLRQKDAFEDLFGTDFGGTSDLDDELDNIFQDEIEPQQSQQQTQKLGLNLGNFDGKSFSYIPHPHQSSYNPITHKPYAPKCEKEVVSLDDVIKIVKIIFEKFPSICISRMKVCGAYPKPTNPYSPSTHNPYSKPTYPHKPSNPYHQHHRTNQNINPATLQNPLFVRSMDSVNSNSTSDGESTDFEEGNGEDDKERSKRSTGEDDLNFIPEDGDDNQPPHYDNYYQMYNDYNHHHPYHYPNSYHPYDYSHQHYNSPYDGQIYLDPYDQGVKHYSDYLHHKYVTENYPYRHIYLDPYDKGVKNYKNYLHHKYVNEKYPNADGIVYV